MPGLGCQGWGVRARVSGLGCQGYGVRVSVGVSALGCRVRVSGLGCQGWASNSKPRNWLLKCGFSQGDGPDGGTPHSSAHSCGVLGECGMGGSKIRIFM